jgi:4-amino-4-deoxy-L-arabinose transferase-like glycosyltransferase
MSVKKESVIFIGIICLGLAIRLWHINRVPAGFFADEASIGYNAYSLLTTGADQYGTRFPVFFKAFGEYKSPIQIYSTVPAVFVFGLNEFAIRLPSAVYGVLSMAALYLLVTELFIEKDRKSVV